MTPNEPHKKKRDENFTPSPFVIDLYSTDQQIAGETIPPLVELLPGRPLSKAEIESQYREMQRTK